MRFPWLILIIFLFPLAAAAQGGLVSGVVSASDNKKPLAHASVFLSNSGVGTVTDDEGHYRLGGVRPGQYTLVVSILGYEQYSKIILIGAEPIKLDVTLAPKPVMLREVIITTGADWKKNFERFKKEFIGSDENAKYCEITNPHILNLTYNPTKQLLHADADQFLVVENKALGYRVKFLLNDFKVDDISGIVSREGEQVFEELPGSDAQKKKWHQKREETYYGSSMHFYRSLYASRLTEEGFIVYHLSRYMNPDRPSDADIRQKVKVFVDQGRRDSANYYIGLSRLSKYTNESLTKPPLKEFELVNQDEQKGLYDIHFRNYLYVVYTRKTDDTEDRDLYRPMDQANYAVSIVTIADRTAYYVFDMNGIIVYNAPLYEGAWARNRLSDMLPVDYVPDQQ
jgi:hypothetical protein